MSDEGSYTTDLSSSSSTRSGSVSPIVGGEEIFNIEKGIYEQLLTNVEIIEGTVSELAEKYNTDALTMTGFLDGIDESLKKI